MTTLSKHRRWRAPLGCLLVSGLLAGSVVWACRGAAEEPDPATIQIAPEPAGPLPADRTAPEPERTLDPEPAPEPPAEPALRSLGHFRVTAYCTCQQCCRQWSRFKRTATGAPARAEDRIIAVDPRVIPLHSRVHVEGLGWFRAEDKGEAIKGARLDVLMKTHWGARRFGARRLEVTVRDG